MSDWPSLSEWKARNSPEGAQAGWRPGTAAEPTGCGFEPSALATKISAWSRRSEASAVHGSVHDIELRVAVPCRDIHHAGRGRFLNREGSKFRRVTRWCGDVGIQLGADERFGDVEVQGQTPALSSDRCVAQPLLAPIIAVAKDAISGHRYGWKWEVKNFRGWGWQDR